MSLSPTPLVPLSEVRAAEISTLREDLFEAQPAARRLDRRVRQLEESIKAFVSLKTLNDGQRTELLRLLSGTRAGARDASEFIYSRAERRLIEQLRAMSPAPTTPDQ